VFRWITEIHVTIEAPRSSYRIDCERSGPIDVKETLEGLFCQYEPAICSYLRRLTGDLDRAQELTQEVFLRTHRALLRGVQMENSRAWLYRVASRLATDDYRRRKVLQWVALLDTDPDPAPAIESTVGERLDVQRALDALSPKFKIPLVLYTCVGYSVAEIAQMLGLSVGAVKMRLYRAREQFRSVYGRGECSPSTSPSRASEPVRAEAVYVREKEE
jgi:RNA polymerase sigma-70 factor (ECF subfamily)